MDSWLDGLDRIGSIVAHVSWQGAVLAGLVLLVLIVVRNSLAPRWRFVLWGLVVARLLLPVIPESRFSLFNAVSRPATPRSADRWPENSLAEGEQSPLRATTTAKLEGLQTTEHPAEFADDAPRSTGAQSNDTAVAPSLVPSAAVNASRLTGWEALALIWFLGALLLTSRIVWQLARLRRQARNWRESRDAALLALLEECRQRLGVRWPVRILVGPDDCGPAVIGLFLPAILLPDRVFGELSPHELRFVLLHELSHVRRHDIAVQWLTLAARTLHWFNPAAWLAAARMGNERELACDEAVLEAIEPENRFHYGETLLRLARGSHSPVYAPGFLATFGSQKSLQRRLSMINGYRHRRAWSVYVALGLIGCAGLAGLTDARSAPDVPPAVDSPVADEISPVSTPAPSASDATPATDTTEGDTSLTADAQAQKSKEAAAGKEGTASSGLAEGWTKTVTIPAVGDGNKVFAREGRLTLRVEKGWLLVRRTTAEDDLEWEVVLARASDPKEPTVTVEPNQVPAGYGGAVDVSYRGYFARENAQGKYSILRERKTAESPEWSGLDPGGAAAPRSTAGRRIFVGTQIVDGWRFLQIGHSFERPDICLRFQPMEWGAHPFPRSSMQIPTSFAMIGVGEHAGEIMARDNIMMYTNSIRIDEDLLVGFRVTFDQAARGLNRKSLARRMETEDPPAIAPLEWIGTAPVTTIEDLRGKVVLLAFGSARNRLSSRQLRLLEALHQKYRDRGLAVVGFYPEAEKERVPQLLKEAGVTFPVAVDSPKKSKFSPAEGFRPYTGETAGRYTVDGLPNYFLIDRKGKFAWGMGIEPPPASEIEELLK